MKLFAIYILFFITLLHSSSLNSSLEAGQSIYLKKCAVCHGKNGNEQDASDPFVSSSDELKNSPMSQYILDLNQSQLKNLVLYLNWLENDN